VEEVRFGQSPKIDETLFKEFVREKTPQVTIKELVDTSHKSVFSSRPSKEARELDI